MVRKRAIITIRDDNYTAAGKAARNIAADIGRMNLPDGTLITIVIPVIGAHGQHTGYSHTERISKPWIASVVGRATAKPKRQAKRRTSR